MDINPIEVQFFTERDYIFNMWLHKYVYKYKDNSIGIKLRELYDKYNYDRGRF